MSHHRILLRRIFRQNTLPGFGVHQRYLRNSSQNPSEEEEEHGPQSQGLTRGLPSCHCRADELPTH